MFCLLTTASKTRRDVSATSPSVKGVQSLCRATTRQRTGMWQCSCKRVWDFLAVSPRRPQDYVLECGAAVASFVCGNASWSVPLQLPACGDLLGGVIQASRCRSPPLGEIIRKTNLRRPSTATQPKQKHNEPHHFQRVGKIGVEISPQL